MLLDDGVRFELGGGCSLLLLVVTRGGAEQGVRSRTGWPGGWLRIADGPCPIPSGSGRRRRWVALGAERNLSGQMCPATRAPMADHYCVYQF